MMSEHGSAMTRLADAIKPLNDTMSEDQKRRYLPGIADGSLRLQAFGDDTASIKAFGLDVVADLCEQLVNGGVPGLHFYTMNQAPAVMAICKAVSG